MRRVAIAKSAALVGVCGCGVIAGLDEQFGYPAYAEDASIAHDATVSRADAGDARAEADTSFTPPDVEIPRDVYTPDGNEGTPDAAEAGCLNPDAGCDTGKNKCCAPAVCNTAQKCVAECIDGAGCGDEAACCYGKHCNEYFQCSGNGCAQKSQFCDLVVGPLCCVGFVCPPTVPAFCQACTPSEGDCKNNWECCSKDCQGGKKCR